MYTINNLFNLNHTLAKDYLSQFKYPFEALKGIKGLIIKLGNNLDKEEYQEISEQVWVHKTAKVFPTAYLGAPCIIGPESEVRHCAFIRGSALIGSNCVVGNSVELKNVILFDNVQVPHYNYVGDSILGYKSHMGAGSITSNVKSDKTLVVLKDQHEKLETGIKKVGAMLGDCVEVGCNSVLNPGTVIGKNATIYPLSRVRGAVPSNSIYKDAEDIVKKRIKGVVFDLDGTLLNTITDLNNSINDTYKFYNYPKNNSEAQTMLMVGHGMKNLISQCFEGEDETFINEALKTFLNYYDSQYYVNTKPYQGISELVEELLKRNIKVGVNSNKNDGYTKHLIELNFPGINQDYVIGIKEGDKVKPDPTNVYRVLEKMKLKNDEVLYIGDSPTDVETAKNASLEAIGVSWGFRSKEKILNAGAEKVIKEPKELLEELD